MEFRSLHDDLQVCQNLQTKKRDVFDMTEKRIEGTVAAEYKDQISEVEKKDRKEWRKQHEDMISAIREAKKAGAAAGRPSTAGDPSIHIMWAACQTYKSMK